MDDGFRKCISKEDANEAFDKYKKQGNILPCQLMPQQMFMQRVHISMTTLQAYDAYAAANACKVCPLREQCEVLGKSEPVGMWGGVSRWFWKNVRRCYEDDWPF